MQDTYKEVFIVLIAGSTILIILSGIIVFVLFFYQKKRYQHQQELLKTQMETRETAFLQIGEELHDNVGQLLSSTKNLLNITIRNLPQASSPLVLAEETLSKAITDIRSLSKSLSPEWLEQFNFVDNLKMEIVRINAAGVVTIKLLNQVDGLDLPPAGAQIMLFRVIQEALQNSIKHSNARMITIETLADNDKINVKIKDDGKGFRVDSEKKSGIGMMNMEHRINLLGGSITWQSGDGKGTEVAIILPVK